MRLIVQRTRPGEVVCDPLMLGRDIIAFVARPQGRKFTGADSDKSCIDRVRHWLAVAEASTSPPGSVQ